MDLGNVGVDRHQALARTAGPHRPYRTITCSLPAGPYTVLLETDAVDATYLVKHQAAA